MQIVFEMLRQSEHLHFRRRQALVILSFIVILFLDFSYADNPNNKDEDTTVPDTALIHRMAKAPLKLVSEIRHAVAGKEPASNGVGENAANPKSPEKPVGSDNNGAAVQSDDVQSDSVSYQYQYQGYPSNGYGYYQLRG
nr:uncharacterized protein LOC118679744 [Bactrocera oleae]